MRHFDGVASRWNQVGPEGYFARQFGYELQLVPKPWIRIL